MKEDSESIKANVKNESSDIKGMIAVAESKIEGVKEGIESMEKDMKDIKKDIKEGEEKVQNIKEVVKQGVKEAMIEMENIEKPEMKGGYTRKLMENVERDDFTNSRVPALGELYLFGFTFPLNMKHSL